MSRREINPREILREKKKKKKEKERIDSLNDNGGETESVH